MQRFLEEKQLKYDKGSMSQSLLNYEPEEGGRSSQSYLEYEVSEEEFSRIEGNISEDKYEQYIQSHE